MSDDDRPTDTGEIPRLETWFAPAPSPAYRTDIDARARETDRLSRLLWGSLLFLSAVALLAPACALLGWLP